MKSEKTYYERVERFKRIVGIAASLISVCAVLIVFGSATFRPEIEVKLAKPDALLQAPGLPVIAEPAQTFSAAPSETFSASAAPSETEDVPIASAGSTALELTSESEPVPGAETAPCLSSINLDADTQASIYALCGNDKALFCAVMAIAREETGFNPTASGDSGRCVGMMQINRNFHLERMERLNVTDLTDPVQCAAVAIDYLRELSETFGWVEDHGLYLAYNAGPVGAENLRQAGICSTRYTYEVLRYYREYMEEFENMEGGNET